MGYFDIHDFVSLACLTNTPYPNNFAVAVTGIDKVNLSARDAINQMFDHKDYDVVVKRMRFFVAWGLGNLDSDNGKYIKEMMWWWKRKYVKRPRDEGGNGDEVESMRQDIYGDCHNGGRDYYNYQPCPPRWVHDQEPIKTLAEFNKAMEEYKDRSDAWYNRLFMARSRLSDLYRKNNHDKRWPYLVDALAEGLQMKCNVLAAGLKKEF